MRPSLTLVLIIAALVISFIIGLVLGGGPQVWLSWQSDSSNGAIANAELLTITTSPTPTATRHGRLALAAATSAVVPTVAATKTPTPPASPTRRSTRTPPPTATVTNETPAPAMLTLTVASDNVRLRTAPGTASQVIRRLNSGTQGVVTGRTAANDWVQVEVPEVASGWISADPVLVTIEGSVENLPIVEVETAEATP
jgi:uncharacterized protein YgiM (DUF1202 family)